MQTGISRSTSPLRVAGGVVLGLGATSALVFALDRLLRISTAASWLYIPLVLLVALRWGAVKGLLTALVANLLILVIVVPPLGSPRATDPADYVRLGLSMIGMIVAVVVVTELNRRRRGGEMRSRVEAETLADLGRDISASLDLGHVLRTAAEAAHRLVRADVTYIAIEKVSGGLEVAAAVGNRTSLLQGRVIPANSGVSGMVLGRGNPMQVHWDDNLRELGSLPRIVEAMEAEGIRSTLAVPILQGLKAVGVFWVHSRTRREFTAAEVGLLERLAAHAAIAIANANVLGEEQQARAEVEALLAATASLGAQAEPDAVLRTLIEQAAMLLKAERAIYAVPSDGTLVVPAYWHDGIWTEDPHATRRVGILWGVWESGVSHCMNDVQSVSTAGAVIRGYSRHNQLTVAIPGGPGANLGVLALNNKRDGEPFTAHDQRLLEAICETGAAVLRRATETASRLQAERVAARRKQEVEALLAVADELNSAMNADEVLRRVIRIAAELVSVRRAGIVTNEGDHALRRHTYVDGVWRSEETRLPLEDSISGWVILHRTVYRSDDFAHGGMPYHPATTAGVPVSALSVPIIGRDGDVLGSLNLFERLDGRPFSDRDQYLAEGIAHHAAIAMERAQLIQELRNREQHLHQQAVTDPLTGLPNRSLFLEKLSHALGQARRRSLGVGVLFLDLDGFKVVNDSLGHAAGDDLLQAMAGRLRNFFPERDTVARFGGDEFAILLTELHDASQAKEAAERLASELRYPLAFGQHRSVSVTASVGTSFRAADEPPRSAQELLREADIALYQAKAAGRGRAVAYTADMGAQAMERLELQADLEQALRRGQLDVVYQPIVDLGNRAVVGTEALVRWLHPRRGLLHPSAFIPLAEETGIIVPVGSWILDQACRQAAAWRAAGAVDEQFRMSVNLSPVQLEQPDLVLQVSDVLRRSGLMAGALQLEITETAVVGSTESTLTTLAALRAVGVQLAIDDFGTGYSSLSYLQRLPINAVKIDQSFMQGLNHGSSTAAIVRAVVTLAHALDMSVAAEGIETQDQAVFLAALGCDHGQGFYFSEPRTAADLTGALRGKQEPLSFGT